MWRTPFIVAGLAVVAASHAHAGFIGQTVGASYQYPNLGTVYPSSSWLPATFVVGPGQDTDGSIEGVTDLLVDFGATTLTITLRTVLSNPTWNAVAFNGPVFASVAPFDIATASVDPSTTMAGFNDSRVSFSANDIEIDWNGLGYVDGTRVQIDFTFIPEPASGTVFALALTGLLAARRPRRRT